MVREMDPVSDRDSIQRVLIVEDESGFCGSCEFKGPLSQFFPSPTGQIAHHEVLPREDLMETCVNYLRRNPRVGIVAVRVPSRTTSGPCSCRGVSDLEGCLIRAVSGPIPWGTGHTLLFRPTRSFTWVA